MNIEEIRTFCLSKPHVEEDFPFDASTLAFKVGGKIFLLCGLDRIPLSINLKCDPDKAIQLRETYEAINPGYHMNKKHWNTVKLEDDVPKDILMELINHSYVLVVKSLTKKKRQELEL